MILRERWNIYIIYAIQVLEFVLIIQISDMGPSIKYVRKVFRKTNISNPLMRTRTCAYQGVGNVSFSENDAYVLTKWPLRVPKQIDLKQTGASCQGHQLYFHCCSEQI